MEGKVDEEMGHHLVSDGERWIEQHISDDIEGKTIIETLKRAGGHISF